MRRPQFSLKSIFVTMTVAAVGYLVGQPIWLWLQRPRVLSGLEGSSLQMEDFEITLWPDGRSERRVVKTWELGAPAPATQE